MPCHNVVSSGVCISGSICFCKAEEFRVDAASSVKNAMTRVGAFYVAVVRVTPSLDADPIADPAFLDPANAGSRFNRFIDVGQTDPAQPGT